MDMLFTMLLSIYLSAVVFCIACFIYLVYLANKKLNERRPDLTKHSGFGLPSFSTILAMLTVACIPLLNLAFCWLISTEPTLIEESVDKGLETVLAKVDEPKDNC